MRSRLRATIAILAFCSALLAPGLRAQGVRLCLAELQPSDHPTTKGDYEFARLVRERSGGRIQITVYADSVMGQEMDVLEQLKFGAIDMARVSAAALSSYVPGLFALQMPYLYRDDDQMWRVLKGEIGKELLASLGPAGFVGLGWFEAGARSFYDTRGTLGLPSAILGLRMRVQEGGVVGAVVNAFGAKPVKLAFGETYEAMQKGLVDGAENNIPTYYTSRHYQVAKYYTLTEHARIPEMIVGSAISFSALSAADRALIAQAALDSIEYQRSQWRIYEALAIAKLRAAGVVIRPISEPESWRSLAEPLYAAQSPAIRALVARIRAVK